MNSSASFLAVFLFAAAWLCSPAPVHAQQTPPPAPAAQPSQPSPPTAQQVFAHYAEAIGGGAAWEKLTSRVTRGTVHISGVDGTATLLIYERAPNMDLSTTTLANGAELRDGFDGKTGWEQDPTGKVKELEGPRAVDRRALADFYSDIKLEKIYPHARLVGQKTADGRLAYVIEASVPGGTPRLLYFDAESWLLFRTDLFENLLSPVPTTIERQDDYRDVDGIQLPFKGSIQGSGVNIQFHFTVLRHNVTVTDDEVARPASSSN